MLLRGLFGPEAPRRIGYRAINAALGLILTFLIYAAIRLFARDGSIRRMAIVAAVCRRFRPRSLMSAASLRMATWSQSRWANVRRSRPRKASPSSSAATMSASSSGDGDELEVNLPPVEEIIADKNAAADRRRHGHLVFLARRLVRLLHRHDAAAPHAGSPNCRLAEAETAAHAAQVRALRYQVNPHFLFNTLNSLSSLVMSGRSDRAEEMLMALSTFFRTSLSIDPSADVSLAEEIGLQRLYLDIEKVRFPDRLEVEIDIPEELERRACRP